MSRVAVMGSGSWGTAFSQVLTDAGNEVVVWGKDPDVAESINTRHENPTYHPGISLPESIRATLDVDEALGQAEIVVLALPAQVVRENLAEWRHRLTWDCLLVSLAKGIELGSKLRMSEVVAQTAGVPAERVAVVSGPNLAREIAERQPAATVAACLSETNARRLQQACATSYFRPYTNTDVIGVEIGGAVKNVIALANGMASGMGFGENAQASLMTRGLAEMTRLGVALGANPMTFLGLAGVGDLIATCQSPLSRNRTFGEHLGRGLSVEETIAVSKQTCEAVKSCRPILELAQGASVDMPIGEQVVEVVWNGAATSTIVERLMSRVPRPEIRT
ncbi:MAG TPA: NAD(P)H-dependent glycerol-3-phosphate dehydrogenase [Actinomycetes bacterium]|nr:NAD(P)H-dependent glycerol-3-phosphate dehydrogenase [Actinomycetes bacterium]